MNNRIFIIDDDKWFLKQITIVLKKHGFTISTAQSSSDAIESMQDSVPDLILLDVIMPDENGFQVCKKIKEVPKLENIPIIFVTATDDKKTITNCFEYGGADYVGKPLRNYELLARIETQLKLSKKNKIIESIQSENLLLKEHLLTGKLINKSAFSSIITVNAHMQSIFKYVEAIAQSSRPVLITGETGVGKEAFASIIHNLSLRPGKMVTINVAGLDDNLFSDTLFGHEKGAFTGAEKDRHGLIEKASKGTLFLDEIGDLKSLSQVKLLRLLQEQEYYQLGSDVRKFTDARIIVATNRDLKLMMEDGSFREDLYYRLRTHQIHIPPLKERKDDLPVLLDHFVKLSAKEIGKSSPAIPKNLIPLLEKYDFPGNIRELEALIFDAVSRTFSKTLSLEIFKDFVEHELGSIETDDNSKNTIELFSGSDFPTIKEMNDLLIDQALERTNGNQTLAAKLLGLTRQALNKRIKRSVD